MKFSWWIDNICKFHCFSRIHKLCQTLFKIQFFRLVYQQDSPYFLYYACSSSFNAVEMLAHTLTATAWISRGIFLLKFLRWWGLSTGWLTTGSPLPHMHSFLQILATIVMIDEHKVSTSCSTGNSYVCNDLQNYTSVRVVSKILHYFTGNSQ